MSTSTLIDCPPIDPRSYQDVVSDTEELLEAYTREDPSVPGSGWSPGPSPDAGSALVRVFAKMAKHIITRLNRVPDRSLLAFLNLVGVEPTPPRPARVPLTFTLSKGGAAEPVVRAGTRAVAASSGGAGEVTFETAADFTVSRAKLEAVIVHEPGLDRYADRSEEALDSSGGYYSVFTGDTAVPHQLYISAPSILALPSGTATTVQISLPGGDAEAWQTLHTGEFPSITWLYWNGAAWTALTVTNTEAQGTSWELQFSIPADIAESTIGGLTSRFLRVELSSFPATSIPAIGGVVVTASVSVTGVAPEAALSGGSSLDLTMDFYPLGEEPKFNSALHVGSGAILSKAGARVELAVQMSEQHAAPGASKAPNLVWEVFSSGEWTQIGRSSRSSALVGSSAYDFHDGTLALTTGVSVATPSGAGESGVGKVTFLLPEGVSAATVKGTKSHWLRARLISGDYGTGIHVSQTTTVTDSGTSTTTLITEDAYTPPVIASIKLGFSFSTSEVAACLTSNDLTLVERASGEPFVPFVKDSETEPAIYLGFDRAFSERVTCIYIDVAGVPLSIALVGPLAGPGIDGSIVVWEISTESGFSHIRVEDDTRAFARSGVVRFLGSSEHARRARFGKSLFWLRGRLIRSGFIAMPKAGRVLTNTVWATHAVMVTDEVVGSSNGEASQAFKVSQTPVLAGEVVEVMEAEETPADERGAASVPADPDAALDGQSRSSTSAGSWVRWSAVPDFTTSSATDRHYRIDRILGELRFGDGRQGMIPPRGPRNVRVASYQAGGGARGNVGALTVKKLQTTVPYVAGVMNHFAASAGADQGDLATVKALGARVLRHRHRAVAGEDFEDLAYEASAAVARARAITPRFDPINLADNFSVPSQAGQTLLLIVPKGEERPPMPSLALIQDIESYIKERCAPAVALRISTPVWIEVSVTSMDIVPVSLDGVDALRSAAVSALDRFFDPLSGGARGNGWEFGQLPHKSDIYRLLGGIPGVRLIRNLAITMVYAGTEPLEPLEASPPAGVLERALIYSGKHVVSVLSPDEVG